MYCTYQYLLTKRPPFTALKLLNSHNYWLTLKRYVMVILYHVPICHFLILLLILTCFSRAAEILNAFGKLVSKKVHIVRSTLLPAKHTDLNFSDGFNVKYVILTREVWTWTIFPQPHTEKANSSLPPPQLRRFTKSLSVAPRLCRSLCVPRVCLYFPNPLEQTGAWADQLNIILGSKYTKMKCHPCPRVQSK